MNLSGLILGSLLQIHIRMSLALCKFDEVIVGNRNGFRVCIGMEQQVLPY